LSKSCQKVVKKIRTNIGPTKSRNNRPKNQSKTSKTRKICEKGTKKNGKLNMMKVASGKNGSSADKSLVCMKVISHHRQQHLLLRFSSSSSFPSEAWQQRNFPLRVITQPDRH
jgi:hypothetical protein